MDKDSSLPLAKTKSHGDRKYSIDMGVHHSLEWNVTSYEVGSGKGKKSILNLIAGKTRSGELTAIMGPSGAGKTTLLECISLRNRKFEGAVHYDNRGPTGEFFTCSVLVHQKELLFGFMTPREHLLFHAIARMSKNHTIEQINARVEEVLQEVKLEKCADTIVGGTDPIYMRKGLSGGERKRLSIAAELLLAPQLIFLDEPSSGLDSVMSESIFGTLKDLTQSGRIVVASVHCPSSEMCQQFTHVLLLTFDGRLAYHGRQDAAIRYFSSLSYQCPENYNPSDFYLKLISATPGADSAEEKARMNKLVAAYNASDMVRKTPLAPDETHKQFQMVFGHASSWTLFKINLWRAFIQLQRDWVTFVLWGLVSALVGGLFGILYWQQARSNWRNLLGLLFSVVVANLFTSSLAVMMRFPLDWAIVVREYFSGSNAIGPYLVARFIVDAPMGYGPFLLITLLYWMTGMDSDIGKFIIFALTFISGNWASTSMGQYVSSFSANPFIGLTILPAFVAPMIMFSGILYERSSVPAWLSWLQTLSIVNYSFSALMIQQIHILPKPLALLVMQFVELNPDTMGWDIGMLWIMNFGFQILTYINLSLRLRFATG
ncbi:hypothetical protein NSK_001894 [Nannochloropsis salina CCMP1776]|uniref:ABC transporter domain-containing protein n=1 Tax=Nannochloropsis salina CCMP1776 TaxID=1027361 RepID=A0A4D9D601_9STRA|nr:hypothetical protein NSK_001894 [Nannochloropsis salina CCMP1776]|eukprot:TFJ86806.1 hypothetical protein NSK_001894 [Nannochloropsis salina CCMP1776]